MQTLAHNPAPAPPANTNPDTEQRRRRANIDRQKANHLSRQLQMRLQYARLKVEHGWQRQNLNEVENLYFHHSHHRRPSSASPARAHAGRNAAANANASTNANVNASTNANVNASTNANVNAHSNSNSNSNPEASMDTRPDPESTPRPAPTTTTPNSAPPRPPNPNPSPQHSPAPQSHPAPAPNPHPHPHPHPHPNLTPIPNNPPPPHRPPMNFREVLDEADRLVAQAAGLLPAPYPPSPRAPSPPPAAPLPPTQPPPTNPPASPARFPFRAAAAPSTLTYDSFWQAHTPSYRSLLASKAAASSPAPADGSTGAHRLFAGTTGPFIQRSQYSFEFDAEKARAWQQGQGGGAQGP